MTMPKFEPVAWLFKGLKPGYRTEFASIDPCESQTWPTDNGMVWNKSELYTSDQLAEAYEAGKRDAAPEWQPIETAPKDGAAFRSYANELIDLDFNPYGSVEAAWNGEEFIGCVWNGQQDSWYGKTINPTHWMPLPAAPKGED